jgi:hypothetical protein
VTITSDTEIPPFRVEISDAELDDLQARLARVRWPDELDGVDWAYGAPLDYVRDLVDRWRTEGPSDLWRDLRAGVVAVRRRRRGLGWAVLCVTPGGSSASTSPSCSRSLPATRPSSLA